MSVKCRFCSLVFEEYVNNGVWLRGYKGISVKNAKEVIEKEISNKSIQGMIVKSYKMIP